MIIPSSLALLAESAVAQPASYAVRQPQPGPPLPGPPSTRGFQNVTVHPSTGGHASCVSGIVPVAASTDKNVKLDFQVPANQSDITEFFLESFSAGSDLAERIAVGNASVAGEYDIYATLCTPMNNSKPKSVQLLTHGVGFDHTYWDFALDYSYVDVAAEHGYASFFYDRLGAGSSDKPDPIQVIQAPLEVEIARTLATFLRNGTFSGQSFEKVIGVGHSFGSIITQAITQLYPEILDAAVLTGFSSDLSNQPTFLQALNLAIARKNQPARFSALNNAFLVSSTIISNQIGFFKANGFDPDILRKAEATKGTVTIGELNSLSGVGGPADRFTKPVIVVDGDADYPFCTGNCSFPTNLAQAVQGKYYPSLADGDFDAYLAPLAGHGLNFHYSAKKAFEYAQEFLAERGL